MTNSRVFQISLSLPPLASTVTFAESYVENLRNPPPPSPKLTWTDILAEEPFSGQHWEGVYGLPPGSTVEGWETRSDGSTPSLSPSDDFDEYEENGESIALSPPDQVELAAMFQPKITVAKKIDRPAFNYRKEVEDLRARQYWRPEWRMDINLTRPIDPGDNSILGASR